MQRPEDPRSQDPKDPTNLTVTIQETGFTSDKKNKVWGVEMEMEGGDREDASKNLPKRRI